MAPRPSSYTDYLRGADDARFSAWLRHCAEPYWREMVNHRFVRDVATDSLGPGVLERYLVYEYAFVRAAVKIFGHALIKTSDLSNQRALVHVLDGLTGDQIDYFNATFKRLNIRPEQIERSPLPDDVDAFR
ncbi:MAG: transcriptional regulator, partial [Gammaproteobacteria bacterium]